LTDVDVKWPIGEDCFCGSLTPRREAYCHFHAGIAAIQRKSVEAPLEGRAASTSF
jgi:hypothetical protein